MPTNVALPIWRAFHAAKRGNAPEEYEDAFAGDPSRGRFAVADGASESSFAAAWAKLLVEGFITASGQPWQKIDWLAPLRQRWSAEVDGRPLPWYAEDKRQQGAFATLLGIVFRKPKKSPRSWRAVAVGDSCLFRLRAGRICQSFPLTRADEFGNLPGLLGSRGRPIDTPQQEVKYIGGRWQPGDRFLLMTDALAEWTLRQTEEDGRPIADIEGLLSESKPKEAFADWIEEKRRQGLRNDDVTLVIIDLQV